MRDLQPVNIETHLKNAVIFNELEDEEIALIAKGAREVRYDKGAPIFHRGYSCTGFHIVVFGQVKLSFTSAHESRRLSKSFNKAKALAKP